ncbi:phosphoribosyl-ATP diphosphatase [Microvenator marinus]|uniref:Histidine biosynthesis bifunctional protein HisIE n=1 Tax=Microvenator marinus TaxID=2600177 RepID=A0A5B8XQ56_9DELT|nr:phosphoribosyl-ATP diphosphatase [Microvenator marinus]QED27227.1 phosphoribosyl-ATP diphosphatase [Microvenator marinus]
MIVPSIDLMGGNAVQLVGGKELKIDAGDPRPIARKFAMAGEIAIVDLDAALRQGDNTETILELLKIVRARVGGGIRDVETARKWLDLGADRIVLGTAATPEILSQLPAERVIAALDAVEGEVVVDGWRTKTGASITDKMAELAPYVSGFLVTFVEKEGRMQGTDMGRVAGLIEAAQGRELTIAGGVTTVEEIAELDRLGVHAQVGMALYSGSMDLGAAIAAPLKSDRPDGLWPTVVTDERGQSLGLAYSSLDSIKKALELGQGVYQSRKRGLWIKGESSGNTQELLEIVLDCDRDALKFVVRQQGEGFCHLGTDTCFGDYRGLSGLLKTTQERLERAPEGSYTKRLLEDDALLRAKLVEEAGELADAQEADHVAQEAADLIYFLSVALARHGVDFAEVERVLDKRALKITRRPGNAK